MEISPTSIYVTIMIFLGTSLRLFYFLFANVRKYPGQLFKGRNLFYFIVMILTNLTSLFFSLFFSNDFHYDGIFILWGSLTGISLCLSLTIWALFWMHGYNPYYQFKKIVLPCPLSILGSFIILLSGSTTLNYYLVASGVIFALFDYLWNYQGYKLTKPVIPEDIPLHDEDDLD